MRVSVIYVNFNTGDLLEDSLRSLSHVEGVDLEVVVVDNASTRQPLDAESVYDVWPGAKIVWSHENVGFGRGCNLGADAASGEILWLLNTDTVLGAGNLVGKLAHWLASAPEYGAATPLLVDGYDVPQVNQVGRLPTLPRMITEKIPWLRGRAINYPDYASRDVDDACAAALMVRTDVFREIGGFDPSYFFFLEDTDLCTRIGRAGYRIRHCTESRVTHLHGQSVGSQPTRKRLYYKGLNLYFSKWRPWWERAGVRALSAAMLAAGMARK